MLRIPLTLLVLGLIGLSTNPACAEDAKEADAKAQAAEPDVPVLEADLAFERYIRLELIGEAWSQLNSAMMTDAVLQLAEGERVLLREHKAFGAAALAGIAVRLAAENNDQDSLARLAKFAASRDNKALTQQITAAEKTAGASSRIEIQVDINELRSEHLDRYKSIQSEILRAKLSQDVRRLERIEVDLAAREGFNPAFREALLSEASKQRKLVASNRSSAALTSPVQEMIFRLSSATRDTVNGKEYRFYVLDPYRYIQTRGVIGPKGSKVWREWTRWQPSAVAYWNRRVEHRRAVDARYGVGVDDHYDWAGVEDLLERRLLSAGFEWWFGSDVYDGTHATLDREDPW